jgi:uncharacterized alpha-E superfamily protein
MLSRIAESLYWIGRYVERADDTGRILDSHVHGRLYGLDPEGVDAGCRRLMAVMGAHVSTGHMLSVADVMESLAYQFDEPTSAAGSLIAARESARGVREVMSAEMWECLNATSIRLPGERAMARRRGPDGFLNFVRRRSALFGGYVDSTMSRDAGWQFLVLGRSLERVDMTARLLSAEVRWGGPSSAWVLLLRSAGGYEAYLRSHRGRLSADGVIQFLVRDQLFPRSLLHALDEAETVLADLEPQNQRTSAPGRARRIVGAARANLAYSEPRTLAEDLPRILTDVQHAMTYAHEAVADRFFRQAAAVNWSSEAVS